MDYSTWLSDIPSKPGKMAKFMARKRKVILGVIGGALTMMAIAFVIKLSLVQGLAGEIPLLSDSEGLSEAVEEQVSEALDLALRKPVADNLGKLGRVYHSSANYEEAGKCYTLAVKRDNSAWLWNYYLGFLNMEMGNSAEVIEQFTQVCEKNPNIDLAWYYLGEAYRNLSRNELAEESFRMISGIKDSGTEGKNTTRYDYFPLGTYARYQLARLYMDTERMELAEKTLLDIIQTKRSFGPAYRLLGNMYRIQGDSVKSKLYGIRANDLLVFSPPVDTLVDRLVLMSRSELYLLKKIDEAERSIYPEWAMKLVNHALQYIPDNKYLISKAIRISLMLDLDDQAAGFADRHIGFYMDNFTEMNNMGLLFFQKGLYPQAIEYLSRALDIVPHDANIQNCLAISYWRKGERHRAEELLNEVMEKNLDQPEVQIEVTSIWFDLGKEEKALAQLERLKKLSRQDPKVLRMCGMLAQADGNTGEAIRCYESSFTRDPEDLSTLRMLGDLLIQQKMWDPYIRQFRLALEHHPNDPFVLERLGTMLITCPDASRRNNGEGRYYAERAFIHKASNGMTLVSAGRSLALAYATMGDKENATMVIQMTLNAARREQVSASYQQELVNIARRIQTIPG